MKGFALIPERNYAMSDQCTLMQKVVGDLYIDQMGCRRYAHLCKCVRNIPVDIKSVGAMHTGL